MCNNLPEQAAVILKNQLTKSNSTAFSQFINAVYKLISDEDAEIYHSYVEKLLGVTIKSLEENSQKHYNPNYFKHILLEDFFDVIYTSKNKPLKIRLQKLATALYVALLFDYGNALLMNIIADYPDLIIDLQRVVKETA